MIRASLSAIDVIRIEGLNQRLGREKRRDGLAGYHLKLPTSDFICRARSQESSKQPVEGAEDHTCFACLNYLLKDLARGPCHFVSQSAAGAAVRLGASHCLHVQRWEVGKWWQELRQFGNMSRDKVEIWSTFFCVLFCFVFWLFETAGGCRVCRKRIRKTSKKANKEWNTVVDSGPISSKFRWWIWL